MFLSETYVYFSEDSGKENSAGSSVKQQKVLDEKKPNGSCCKSGSQDEDTANDQVREPNSQNLNYDGDTDTDYEEEEEEEQRPAIIDENKNISQCEICHLEYTTYHEDKFNRLTPTSDSPEMDFTDRKVSKRNARKKAELDRYTKSPERKPEHSINFEDYKDWNHLLDKFDPESERIWTLQYRYHQQEYEPKLSKIIIGRGHHNEYPELNNIHLIEEVKGYRHTVWRKYCLSTLKQRNDEIKERHGLFPGNNACLFCFEERCEEIMYAAKNKLPLKAKPPIKATGYEVNKISYVKMRNGKLPIRELGNGDLQNGKSEADSDQKFKFRLKNVFKKQTKELHVDKEEDDEEFTVI